MKRDSPLLMSAPPSTTMKANRYANINISFSKRCVQTIAAADPESTSGGLSFN